MAVAVNSKGEYAIAAAALVIVGLGDLHTVNMSPRNGYWVVSQVVRASRSS